MVARRIQQKQTLYIEIGSPQLKLWPFNDVPDEISVSARSNNIMVVLQIHSLLSLVSFVIVSKNDKSVLYTNHESAKLNFKTHPYFNLGHGSFPLLPMPFLISLAAITYICRPLAEDISTMSTTTTGSGPKSSCVCCELGWFSSIAIL